MVKGIWLNTCLSCGTNNPAPEMKRPHVCTGCGLKLECVKQEWNEAVGILHQQELSTYLCKVRKRNSDRNNQRDYRRARARRMKQQWLDSGVLPNEQHGTT
jgi:hypothetical protein